MNEALYFLSFVLDNNIEKPEDFRPMEMSFSVRSDVRYFENYSLSLDSETNQGNYFKNCIEQACSGFAFNFTVDDPDYFTHNQLTEGPNKIHNINVLLLYFAFEDGTESKPIYANSYFENEEDDDAGGNFSSSQQRLSSQPTNLNTQSNTNKSNKKKDKDSSNDNEIALTIDGEPLDDIFNVFWA